MTRGGHRLGRLILTTTLQPPGAPILDSAGVGDEDGRRYGALVVRVGPRLALVAGWRGALTPNPHLWGPRHALDRLRRRTRWARPPTAAKPYDGEALADVTVGEDAEGIRLAGALRPGVTPAQVRARQPRRGDPGRAFDAWPWP